MGIFAWPIQVASIHNIRTVFYGESTGLIGLGRKEDLEKEKYIDRKWVEEHSGMNGLRLNDILSFEKTLKKENLTSYIYPDENILKEKKIESFFIGSYFKWDHQKIINFIQKEYSWKKGDKPTDGDYDSFEDLDCGFMPMHQYFKFIKYGYSRATDHASIEIRLGRITRKKGLELVKKHEGRIPKKYLEEFLNEAEITKDEFIRICEKFTNKKLFKTAGVA